MMQERWTPIDIAARVAEYKNPIVTTFVVLPRAGSFVQFAVPVNYSMTDYLPESAPSTEAIDVMEEEFSGDVANTRVMVQDVTIQEALHYKEAIEAVDGVSDVMWLDDVIDIQTPVEMADADTVDTYYKDNHALFTFYVKEGKEVQSTDAVYDIIGGYYAMAAEALDTAISQKMTGQETLNAALILVPTITIILLLSTPSWT